MKKLFVVLFFTVTMYTYAQVYTDVANYFIQGTPTNGVKIKTNIPFQHGLGMPTIIIEGYSYGTANTIGLTIIWYVYNGNFYAPKMSSWGGYTPIVKLAEEGGKIIIFIDDRKYYDRFSIRAYANGQGENSSMFDGWTIVDEAINSTIIKIVPYENRFAGNIYFPYGKWQEDGNVGIGTSSINSPLTVRKATQHMIPTLEVTHISGNPGCSGCYNIGQKINVTDDQGTSKRNIGLWIDASNAAYNYAAIFEKGNVLIGKTSQQNPSYKLDVAGSIRANEVKVNLDGADFVFENNYELLPINEVENFIKENKHLPDIKPAAEMKIDGANLGELNTKLLQKIEELTLYMIDQNKRIEKLEKENQLLRETLNLN